MYLQYQSKMHPLLTPWSIDGCAKFGACSRKHRDIRGDASLSQGNTNSTPIIRHNGQFRVNSSPNHIFVGVPGVRAGRMAGFCTRTKSRWPALKLQV